VANDAALRLAERLVRCTSLDEFEAVYLRGAVSLFGLPMQAISLSDQETRAPQRVKAVSVSDAFLERYDRYARPIDPMLAHVLRTRRATSNIALMSMEEWVDSELYSGFSWVHEIRYTIEAPVVVDGEVAGMLCCSAAQSTAKEWQERVDALEFLGRMVGITVQAVRARTRVDEQRQQVLDVLGLVGTAVVVSDVTGNALSTNPAARRLLDELADGERLLYAVAASTVPGDRFARSIPACRRDGAEVMIRASSRRSIADRLTISRHPVNQHVKRAYQKLDVHNRVGLARVMLRSLP
jgi:GAF domain-containing protein